MIKHGLYKHKLYSVWRAMKSRCSDTKRHNYYLYGGKGISVCDLWLNDFLEFFNWSNQNGFVVGLSIDRIKSNLGYSPDNCRWVSMDIQSRNKSKRRNSLTKFIGVSTLRYKNKLSYQSTVWVDKQRIHLGTFKGEKEAATTRDKYIIDNGLIGYRLNFPS